ncbi:MAG: hypothetical protein WBK94_02990 [Tenuifilaceae bacterium]
MLRIRCRLFGCAGDVECRRCGADYYDVDYITSHRSIIGEIDNALWRQLHWLKEHHLLPYRCCHCGKWIWWRSKRANVWWCSVECYDEWLPF